MCSLNTMNKQLSMDAKDPRMACNIHTVVLFSFSSREKIGINTYKIKSSGARDGQVEESEAAKSEIEENEVGED